MMGDYSPAHDKMRAVRESEKRDRERGSDDHLSKGLICAVVISFFLSLTLFTLIYVFVA